MPVLEHRVSAILDVDQFGLGIFLQVEHHFDDPDLARRNLRKGAFPRPKVDVATLTYVLEGEVW